MDKSTARALAGINQTLSRICRQIGLETDTERTARTAADLEQSGRINDTELALCDLDQARATETADLEMAVCELSEVITNG